MLLAAAQPAGAEGVEPARQVYRLGEILVTERYLEPEVGTSYQVTRDHFDRTNARALDEALKEIPSINVRNGADGTPRLDVRGLRTRQIKLLVNGIPFNSADDGQFDPTLIPTFAIGRIQLQAGASSVLYGDGGMGGVLDIQTRGGFDGLHAGGRAEFGSDHLWNTNAYLGYGDGTNDFFAAAGVRARDGFPLSDDYDSSISPALPNYENGGERNNSDYRRANIITSFNRKVTDALTLGVFLSHVEGRYGKPPTVFDSKTDDFAQNAKYERTDDQRGTSVQVGADYDPGGAWSGRLWFYANSLREDQTGYDDATYSSIVKKNAYREDDHTLIRGVHAQLNGVMASSGTGWGIVLDQRKEEFDASGVLCEKNTCNPANYTVIDVDRELGVTSVSGEITQALPLGMNLIAGIGHHILKKDGGDREHEQSAQIGLSRTFAGISTVYGTLARKVDAPTIRQLYDAKSGNAQLGFQRANHMEAGVRNRWARAGLEVAVYRTRVYDFIEKDDVSNLYMNRQELLFQGVDVSGRWQPFDALTLRAGVGLLHARDESGNVPSETLQYRPRNKVTLGADYRFLGNWVLNGSYQHIGEQAYFSRKDPAVHRNLDSYDLVSAQLRYLLPQGRGAVYVGADNLFDEDYSTSYGFPQAGRVAYAGVQLDW